MNGPQWFAWLCPDCPFSAQVIAWSSEQASPYLDGFEAGHQAMHEMSS